jgi:hypothetical protein
LSVLMRLLFLIFLFPSAFLACYRWWSSHTRASSLKLCEIANAPSVFVSKPSYSLHSATPFNKFLGLYECFIWWGVFTTIFIVWNGTSLSCTQSKDLVLKSRGVQKWPKFMFHDHINDHTLHSILHFPWDSLLKRLTNFRGYLYSDRGNTHGLFWKKMYFSHACSFPPIPRRLLAPVNEGIGYRGPITGTLYLVKRGPTVMRQYRLFITGKNICDANSM